MIPYIINVALILAGCLVFYKLLLRKETFYRINRYVLVLCLFISFSLPLVPVSPQWSLRKTQSTLVEQKPTITPVTPAQQNTTAPAQISPAPVTANDPGPAPFKRITFQQLMTWLSWLYWFGVIIFAMNFIFQMILLIRKAVRNPVIVDGRYRIVEVSGDKAPCSFGNTIYINPEKYDWDTYNQIILHEKVHIRERHTLDIIIAELMLIFQWFNPFAWVYRREIENNLEFLTDDRLTQVEKVEKTSYQLSLLKVSAPHFPLSLTTNYNQSILKKRIAMMNSKRSNLHTAWKYFFFLPVLVLLACLLNEPKAQSKKNFTGKINTQHHTISTEGYWFAVVKDDKVNIRFSDDEDMSFDNNHGYSSSGTTFKLSELSSVPKGAEGKFTITREAGTMDMTGKFEGNTGMGRYSFKADQAYVNYMNTELKEKLDEEEQMAFWFVDVKKGYLQMLRGEGFTSIEKDDLIAMSAMHIDAAYIKSIKDNGFKDVTAEDLIPLKAMHVDAAYIKEIRDAGYKNVTTEQLITFKSQGIDKDYITKIRQLKGKDADNDEDEDGDDIVTYKSMNITEEFINSFKAVGYTNIPNDDIVSLKAMNVTPEFIKSFQDMGLKNMEIDEIISFKALGVTPEFIKSFEAMGYKNIESEDLTAMKSLGITPEYIKSFEAIGYKNIDIENLSGLKAVGVTPEYIKSFEAIGYKNIDMDELTGLKAMNVTPEFVKGFEAIGYKNIPIDDLTGLKAVGVTPEYITTMKAKGFNYDKLHKYVTLKSID